MTDHEPDLDLSWLLDLQPAPPGGPDRLRSRLRRRRRWGASVAATVTVAALTTAIVVSFSSHGDTTSKNLYVRPPATTANACANGSPPVAREARVGDSIRFTTIPAGFVATTTGFRAPVFDEGEVLAPPGATANGSLAGPRIVAAIELDTTSPPSVSGNLTIQGHPSTFSDQETGRTEQVELTWNPEPGVTITVQATGVPAAIVKALAQTTVYDPGRVAPSVGDVGPVISRANAIQAAIGTPNPGPGLRVATWLTTSAEIDATQTLATSGHTPNQDPYWIVYTTGTYSPDAQPVPGVGVQNNKGMLTVAVDAISGDATRFEGGGTDPTVPPEYAGLTDHSTDQPCPSPSPTEPSLQPPITGSAAYPTGIKTVTAHIIQRHADVPYEPTVDVGSTQFPRGLQPVTTPPTAGTPGALLGLLAPAAPDRASISLITAPYNATGVRIDGTGNIGVIVGGGTDKPLHLYMINRNIPLHPGMQVTTAGPAASDYPPGILVGTITTVTPNPGQSPTVTVTPAANPDTATTVQILETTG